MAGFVSLLEVCKSRNPQLAIVCASSSSVYGLNSKVPFFESDKTDLPMSFYAATKKADYLVEFLSITYILEGMSMILTMQYSAKVLQCLWNFIGHLFLTGKVVSLPSIPHLSTREFFIRNTEYSVFVLSTHGLGRPFLSFFDI
ncbi:unnamed protein product [Cuscuta campestris]|uniref:NAD(P)-binding domain-containing protein n=1 Tax=Cuscuta campestris TaxID=132261 RepID=A0A484MLY8_9ASTE|nr:unnamed protein product [Cuscuta campestris]